MSAAGRASLSCGTHFVTSFYWTIWFFHPLLPVFLPPPLAPPPAAQSAHGTVSRPRNPFRPDGRIRSTTGRRRVLRRFPLRGDGESCARARYPYEPVRRPPRDR